MTEHEMDRRLPYALHRPTCTVPAGCFAGVSREIPISSKSMEYVAQPLDYNHRLRIYAGMVASFGNGVRKQSAEVMN